MVKTVKGTKISTKKVGNKPTVNKVVSNPVVTLTPVTTVTTVTPNVTVTPQTVGVKVVNVKPQIVYVKRLLHNYLKQNGLNHTNSTTTKPQVISNITPQQVQQVQTQLNTYLQGINTIYNYTTTPQTLYIQNHFITHSNKYLGLK